MKRILTAVALTALGASLATAADDPMASRYGNTIVVKGADGKEVGRLYYDADGNSTRKGADGMEAKGTWKIEGANLCFTQATPAPAKPEEAKQCAPFSGPKNVGDSWEVTTPNGKLTATLAKGRP